MSDQRTVSCERVDTPPELGHVVAICEHKGRVIVACQWGLLEFFHEEGLPPLLVKLEFTDTPGGQPAAFMVRDDG